MEDEGRWLILLPDRMDGCESWCRLTEDDGLEQLQASISGACRTSRAVMLKPHGKRARPRRVSGGNCGLCTTTRTFEAPRSFWPDMAKFPRFASGMHLAIIGNKTTFMIPETGPFVLGLLMSRAPGLSISQLCVAHRRASRACCDIRFLTQFMSRLPIPDAPAAEREAIGGLATQITAQAQARYALHRQARHRILTDLAAAGKGGVTPPLNQKLTAWWELDFPAFRGEIQKVFRQDIPLKERDAWEAWLAEHRGQHDQLTAAIVAAGNRPEPPRLHAVRPVRSGDQADRGKHEVPVRGSVKGVNRGGASGPLIPLYCWAGRFEGRHAVCQPTG